MTAENYAEILDVVDGHLSAVPKLSVGDYVSLVDVMDMLLDVRNVVTRTADHPEVPVPA